MEHLCIYGVRCSCLGNISSTAEQIREALSRAKQSKVDSSDRPSYKHQAFENTTKTNTPQPPICPATAAPAISTKPSVTNATPSTSPNDDTAVHRCAHRASRKTTRTYTIHASLVEHTATTGPAAGDTTQTTKRPPFEATAPAPRHHAINTTAVEASDERATPRVRVTAATSRALSGRITIFRSGPNRHVGTETKADTQALTTVVDMGMSDRAKEDVSLRKPEVSI